MALTQPGAVSDDEHGERCAATRGLAGAWGRRPGAILQQCLSTELRTTVHPQLLPLPRLLQLAREVGQAGAGNLVLQPYRDPQRRVAPQASAALHQAAQHMASLLGPVGVRAA
jgi:hypothetical protein